MLSDRQPSLGQMTTCGGRRHPPLTAERRRPACLSVLYLRLTFTEKSNASDRFAVARLAISRSAVGPWQSLANVCNRAVKGFYPLGKLTGWNAAVPTSSCHALICISRPHWNHSALRKNYASMESFKSTSDVASARAARGGWPMRGSMSWKDTAYRRSKLWGRFRFADGRLPKSYIFLYDIFIYAIHCRSR